MKNKSKIISVVLILCIVIIVPVMIYDIRGDINNVELPDNFENRLSEDAFENTGDIRIMSSNLLVDYQSWGGIPAKPRAKEYIAILDAYKPDVIGVQELCSGWFCALNSNLPSGYKLISPFLTGILIRMSAMIYNSDTLDMIDSDTFSYDNGDPRLRRVVWAVFESRKTEKRFAVTNTHLDLLREGKEEKYANIMRSQRDELLNCVEELSSKYNCPVFSIGDFNTVEDTPKSRDIDFPEIYNSIAEKLVDTKFVSENQICGTEKSWLYPCYDHIFMKGNSEINSFCFMSYDYLTDMSDHYMIFADITL